jgi:plasmid stabilization system protein ParE
VDFRVVYTQKALNDLANIVTYIANHDATSAVRFSGPLLDHIELLAQFPRMGSLVKKRVGVRKLLHSPILVYYRINTKKRLIEVLHFRHGARKPPRSSSQIF